MRKLMTLALVAVVSAGSWFAWLGWDHTYQIDPSTGVASGPYETWQGVGSGLTVVLAVIIAVRFVTPVAVAAASAIAYAFAWGWTSFPEDEDGLAGVGLIMILIGVFFGTLAVGFIADTVFKAVRKPPQHPRAA